ncbi:alpha-ketoacid dehydrogenase subunit alpha/beta [uncultured Tateyamaria sp.]|uniref:dehydrogenase E1 component subunit alpha/beta n=1 Tax=uncultured Tateyamaria sp. TaxID=455651 RepID=UPI002614E0E0|nr:alpha-ketoacid dehydrogenase subunit alpha/beta [uncultured Tateyamaria sp.]
MDRAAIVHDNFHRRLKANDLPMGSGAGDMDAETLLTLFRAQCLSRQLDRTSRAMQKAGQGYYTIGSSGHEGMAGVAHALRPTDMAFLHYRDAAFQIARAGQVPNQTPAWDILLSFAASAEDPMSGGRHKVLGSKALNIPPQTSTIASHLPKAVGAAYSIGLAKRQRPEHAHLPDDSLVICSFGDASVNHSTAQGAINTACWTSFQNAPLPLLFVCEDNGIGISTPTPSGWVAANFSTKPGLTYFACDGLNVAETQRVTAEAAAFVRRHKSPAFLHIRTVRLYGHAGSDVEATYRAKADIEADEGNDPLLHTARLLRDSGTITPEEALALYEKIGGECEALAARATKRSRLQTSADVSASLIPPARTCATTNGPSVEERAQVFGTDLRSSEDPQVMSKLISWALTDLMLEHPEVIMAGEDIGKKGGVYGATQKLQSRFGPHRVIDTLLDEQSILGLAIGMAHNGFVPIPEIQFLAYLHNAEDQLRGEAATLPFFSNGQYTNPIVLRIAGLGYQRGFGGHFHNDNSLAVLRDIPGLIIACPSRGDDAAKMLREAVRLAREEQRVVVFVEPIALYPMRDLHAEGDKSWMSTYPAPDERIALGDIGVSGTGTDLAIVTYGNGRYLSEQAAQRLQSDGINTRVIDMRWLAPLPEAALIEQVKGCNATLIVDECRRTGSQSEALMTLFAEADITNIARLAAEDCFIATGPAYAATLPSTDSIVGAAKTLISKS